MAIEKHFKKRWTVNRVILIFTSRTLFDDVQLFAWGDQPAGDLCRTTTNSRLQGWSVWSTQGQSSVYYARLQRNTWCHDLVRTHTHTNNRTAYCAFVMSGRLWCDLSVVRKADLILTVHACTSEYIWEMRETHNQCISATTSPHKPLLPLLAYFYCGFSFLLWLHRLNVHTIGIIVTWDVSLEKPVWLLLSGTNHLCLSVCWFQWFHLLFKFIRKSVKTAANFWISVKNL